jgi:hypothetical protein
MARNRTRSPLLLGGSRPTIFRSSFLRIHRQGERDSEPTVEIDLVSWLVDRPSRPHKSASPVNWDNHNGSAAPRPAISAASPKIALKIRHMI